MRGWPLLVLIAACYQPSAPLGAPCDELSPCPNGQTCTGGFCSAADAGNAQDTSCGIPTHCEGDDLVTCEGRLTCGAGCDDGKGQCRGLVPSNGLSPTLLVGVTGNVVGNKLDFDSSTGRIKQQNMLIRPEGPGVLNGIGFTVIDGMGVFTAVSFDLQGGGTFTITGGNALVLYAATTINFAGTFDVGGNGGSGGPGGNAGGTNNTNLPCRGVFGVAGATGFGAGGGGGGGATAGGNGGPSNGPTPGIGGSMCNTPSTIPLRGGHGGGAGGVNSSGVAVGGRGGGGGGAIAIVAMESIAMTGTIGAPGAGGFSGATGDGGGGGGGGGAILLESPRIRVDGILTANGGGGAGPSNSFGGRGSLTTSNPAVGGVFNGASGGRGGAGMSLPTNGENTTDNLTFNRGGGGGGAVGRIEIRGIEIDVSTMTLTSPAAALTTATVN
ncbi:MAG TPA: hypothetical protein VFQ53_42720 [Kofleriaceae bacterium]|nr:hypothetical protein [Kofleriaceae bacterium]